MCAVYDVRRLLTHYTEFRVHRVILDIVLLDRTECAESDVQRNIGERNAFIGDALQKLRREVQPAVGAAAEPGSREYTVW